MAAGSIIPMPGPLMLARQCGQRRLCSPQAPGGCPSAHSTRKFIPALRFHLYSPGNSIPLVFENSRLWERNANLSADEWLQHRVSDVEMKECARSADAPTGSRQCTGTDDKNERTGPHAVVRF
jgi:hypothetical protein